MAEAKLVAQDIATASVRNFIRAEIWSVSQASGLAPPNQPPPPSPPTPTHLRLVKPQLERELPHSPSEFPKPPEDG
jgi:hypothetical protein